MKAKALIPPTLLLAISGLLSRFLGVVRDHLLAKTFGATAGEGIYNLDAYYAAFRIPDLLYNLLIFGAVSAAFIPLFTRYKKDKDWENAWAFASSMLHLMLLGMVGIAGVVFIFAPQLAPLVAGGLDAQALELTVKLMRILLLSPILFAFSAVFISLQDSFKTFFYRSLAPLLYNVGIIGGIVYWGAEFGVVGVTWGVILGAFLQTLVQLPALKQIGFKHVWVLGMGRRDIRKAFTLMVPRILGLSLNQFALLANTLIASFLMTGAITIFFLADNLQALPLGLIGVSFAITSFATLSELASEPSKTAFARELKRIMHFVLLLVLPATVGMVVLRAEIVDVILTSGKFSPTDALLTSQMIALLLLSAFAQSLIPLLSRGFYAYHNTKTPVLTGLVGAVVNVGLSAWLALGTNLGIFGIAIGFSAGNIVNFLLLYFAMNRHLKTDLMHWGQVFKILFASAVMGWVVWWVRGAIGFEGSLITKLALLLLMTGVGIVVYFGLMWVMGLRKHHVL